RARRSGVSRRTVPESATSTSTSETPRWTPTGATPRAAARPAGGSIGTGGSAGKSRRMPPSPARTALSTPLRVSKASSAAGSPSSQRRWADASVACPQRSTSTAGVNHRKPYRPSPRGERNAVSATFISLATACIQPGSAPAPTTHTPAGLPPKGRSAKASTWKIRTSPLRADEAGDGGGGLGHLGVGVGRAGGHRLPHAVVHVVLQQFEGHRLQRPGG